MLSKMFVHSMRYDIGPKAHDKLINIREITDQSL